MQDNPAYCAHIYKNIYIEKHPNNRSRISACCINQSDTPKSYVNFDTDAYLNDQRDRIAKGEKISACAHCWQQEAQGTFSVRRSDHRDFSRSHDPYKVELLGVDYNVAPICNAKCIMCSSYFSSAWAAEDAKFGVPENARSFNNTRHNQTDLDLDLSRVQRLYFNGGEPFLSEDMPLMLAEVAEAQGNLSQVAVSLNTNGSIWPRKEILDLFATAGSVVINVSIDAVGRAFDYIRNPLTWLDVENNVQRFAAQSLSDNQQYKVVIACTVGVHNAFEISRLQQWVAQQKQTLSWLEDLVVQPALGALSLEYASTQLADRISTALPQDLVGQRIRCWLHSNTANNNRGWISYLDRLDHRRELNWRHALPELAEAVQHCLSANQ